MNQTKEDLLEILKVPTVCMLAPSFPIDFKYPQIIGMLKKLGFDKVTELTYGARIVNYWYVEYVKKHPNQKFYITTPCPTCVALIKASYPDLLKYLVPHVSPMAAMAKIVKKNYPDHKIVFLSPCFAKQKIEGPKYKDVIDVVITFKDMAQIFTEKGISEEDFKGQNFEFDSFYEEDTKIYPISGGLAKTAQLSKYFKPEEIVIADEPINLMRVFREIQTGKTKGRFFDILNCPGGCIGGPALTNTKLPVGEKISRILEYQKQTGKEHVNSQDVELNNDLDFSAKL